MENSKEWENIMDDEIKCDLVRLSNDKIALHNKWVDKLKEEPYSSKCYNAKLVVKGFQHKERIDYTEIFSPMVKMTNIMVS